MNPKNFLEVVSILLFGIKKNFFHQHHTFIITITSELNISFLTEGSRSLTTLLPLVLSQVRIFFDCEIR